MDMHERRKWAVLADIHEKTHWVSWGGDPNVWHMPSRWRGLRPGEGIPDEMRAARTLCGKFIPLPFDQSNREIADEYCVACERENERMKNA